ncbi:MAG: hypothetical protein AB7K09_04920 [Planctomycetota bacterium]
MRLRIPTQLDVPTIGDLIDLACARSDADFNSVLTAAMKVLGTDGWPDGDVEITGEQATAVLLELGFRHAVDDNANAVGDSDAAATADPMLIAPDLHLRTVGDLIDHVSGTADDAHQVINGLAAILNAAMAELATANWPDGDVALTREQGVAILLRLGYRQAAEHDGERANG